MRGIASDTVHVAEIGALDFEFPLSEPIVFGDYVISTRGYSMVLVRAESGALGAAFTLNRGGAVADLVRQNLAPAYRGPVQLSAAADHMVASNPGLLSAGLGLRAVSVLECALWDALARERGQSYLGLRGMDGEAAPLPATLVVGFPPSAGPEVVAQQVSSMYAAGWRGFKLPVGMSDRETIARVRAAAEAANGSWIGLDLAWRGASEATVRNLVKQLPQLKNGWLEDAFRPGGLQSLAEVGHSTGVPTAAGDDDGGPYFMDAIRLAGLDVVRLDATCQGGLLAMERVGRALGRNGMLLSPHLYAEMHSNVLALLGLPARIEFSLPGTGVDPLGDLIPLPAIKDGQYETAPNLGLGSLNDIAALIRTERFPERAIEFVERFCE